MNDLHYTPITIGENCGYAVSDAETHLLYFPLQAFILEISVAAYGAFESGDVPAVLIDQVVKVLEGLDTILLPEPGARLSNNVLGIALGNGCNLACVYCHADAGELTSSVDIDMAGAAISLVVRKCVEDKRGFLLVINGSGEPTFSWKILVAVVEFAKSVCEREGVNFQVIMSTNGIFGKSKRKYLAENFSQISLSLDGPEDVQNSNRPTRAMAGSFSTAFETAKFFYEQKVPFGLRSTVDAKQAARLPEIFDFFQEHFPGTHVAFEPVIPMGRASASKDLENGMGEFVEGFAEIIRNHGRTGFSYSGVTFGRVTNQFCGPVSGAHFNVAMNGTLQACSRVGSSADFVYGTFLPSKGGFEIDEGRRSDIAKISVEDFDECHECFAKYNCAGDCPDMRSRSSLRCDANRSILWSYLLEETKRGAVS